MNRTVISKLNKKGFTLSETLITVLILLMVTSVIAGGMPMAVNAYKSVHDASDAEALVSTAVSAMRDELSTARNIVVSGGTITYVNSETQARNCLYNNDGIMIDTSVPGEEDFHLVQAEKYESNMHLEFIVDSDAYDQDKGLITIKEVYVLKDGNKLSSVNDYVIWVVMD